MRLLISQAGNLSFWGIMLGDISCSHGAPSAKPLHARVRWDAVPLQPHVTPQVHPTQALTPSIQPPLQACSDRGC